MICGQFWSLNTISILWWQYIGFYRRKYIWLHWCSTPYLAIFGIMQFLCHPVFHWFLSIDSKQDATNAAAHSKWIIKLLKNMQLLFYYPIIILDNTDGCSGQYRCANALYLLPTLAHEYNIIIDNVVGSMIHGREIVNGLNATETFLYQC